MREPRIQLDTELWKDVRVLVATTHFGQQLHVQHALSMADFGVTAAPLLAAGRIGVNFELSQPLDWRRSMQAKHACVKDYTHIWFVDSDMDFQFTHLQQLLSRRVDIVTGSYFMGTTPPGRNAGRICPCTAARDGIYISRQEILDAAQKDVLVPVDTVGAGCLLIRTDALERIGHPAFRYNWIMGGDWSAPEYEDGWFSRMALHAGFQLWMDPTVRPDHFKIMRVGLELRDNNGTIIAIPEV